MSMQPSEAEAEGKKIEETPERLNILREAVGLCDHYRSLVSPTELGSEEHRFETLLYNTFTRTKNELKALSRMMEKTK